MRILQFFSDKTLENLYQVKTHQKNKFAAQKLLTLNIVLSIFFAILALINDINILGFTCLLNIFILSTLFILYNCRKTPQKILTNSYIFISILAPLIVILISIKFNHNLLVFNGDELFILGFCLKIFVANIYLFELSWLEFAVLKAFFTFSLLIYNLEEEKAINFSFPYIILFILTFLGFIFDYHREKKDRESFFNEYLFEHHFENLKQIFENVPDLILIYQKKGLVFVNNSTQKIFETNNLTEINKGLNENININNEKSEIWEGTSKNSKSDCFWEIIQNYFEKIGDSHSIAGKSKNNEEFDIKIKRLFWKNEISLLVLIAKVSEQNMRERLDLVNSFLTFVLGNISHEINTPLHIIQGNLESIKVNDKNKENLKIIENFLQILNSMTEIMIDLFFIRKGNIYLSICKIETRAFFEKIVSIFKQCFHYKDIDIQLKILPKFIHTDPKRLINIFTFILNKLMQKMENGVIKISLILEKSNPLQPYFYKVLISCSGMIKSHEDISSSVMNFKGFNFNCPFGSPKSKKKIEYEFSLIDALISCLSWGVSNKLESFELKTKEPEITFTNPKLDLGKENNLLSKIHYSFKIYDCLSEKKQFIKLKDPFQEKEQFLLNFIWSSLNTQEFSEDLINDSEICIKLPENNNFTNEITDKIINKPTKFRSRILNVDDLLFSLKVITNYCHSLKLHVEEAKNGLEAYLAVENLYNEEKEVFDLIFMDIDMPIMNGFDSAKKINEFLDKKVLGRKSIILAVTANVNNEELIINCQNSGIKEALKKPLTFQKFQEIIDKYLGKK